MQILSELHVKETVRAVPWLLLFVSFNLEVQTLHNENIFAAAQKCGTQMTPMTSASHRKTAARIGSKMIDSALLLGDRP